MQGTRSGRRGGVIFAVVNIGGSVSYLPDLLYETARVWGEFSRENDFLGIFDVDAPLNETRTIK